MQTCSVCICAARLAMGAAEEAEAPAQPTNPPVFIAGHECHFPHQPYGELRSNILKGHKALSRCDIEEEQASKGKSCVPYCADLICEPPVDFDVYLKAQEENVVTWITCIMDAQECKGRDISEQIRTQGLECQAFAIQLSLFEVKPMSAERLDMRNGVDAMYHHAIRSFRRMDAACAHNKAAAEVVVDEVTI
eukprot:428407-Pelagomonas_calceolata.AAC.3